MKHAIYLIYWIILFLPMNHLFGQLTAGHLTCEYKTNPMGIGEEKPRLSWRLLIPENDSGIIQTGYHIQAARNQNDLERSRNLIWDTDKIMSGQSLHVLYDGDGLNSRDIVHWKVKIWDNKGRESAWSQISQWEMGLLDTTEWQARWISPELDEKEKEHNPSPMMRKEFELKRNIVKARLYITSHGLYEARINGQRVGDQLFTPGWTSYQKRLQYQVYDVTDLVQSGKNAAGVILGDGWYRGKFGWADNWNVYGKELALLFQLEIEYSNGRKELVISDDSWKCTTGPIRLSSLYDGEIYDSRLEMAGWTKPEFEDENWSATLLRDHSKNRLIASGGLPVMRIKELQPKELINTPKGEVVLDFGQNLVGWVKVNATGQSGDKVNLLHAEVLDKEGNFYTDNLRSAEQKTVYILDGSGEQTFEPHFTFQGFRYVKIVDYPGQPNTENFTAVVIHSDMEETGNFTCSNPMINQLQSNIQWGQRGNFLDVPTDCPQRDERMGWTGDAQAFASTACFNFNTAVFFEKWLADLEADQKPDGSVPFVVPNALGPNASGSTGWGDAATIVPWTVYQKYGDKTVLINQYQSMRSWVDFLHQLAGEDLIVNDGFHFGDWLFFIHPTEWNVKPGYTDIDFLATAFFIHSTSILVQTAEILGNSEDVEKYTELLNSTKSVFRKEFITPSGRLSSHSQTAYTLALAFDLIPEDLVESSFQYLVENIVQRNFHLSTGFLGTPHLCHVLSKYGRSDIAYKLLTQETYPSWLYPVTRGATTIWERWDGIKPDSTFQNTRMNSFNHYAYGAIGDWMYQVIAGIREDSHMPGYKHIMIKPEVDTLLEYAGATHESLYGTIASSWKMDNDSIQVDIRIPPNTTATVYLPESQGHREPFELGSGMHSFHYKFQKDGDQSLNLKSTLEELWTNDHAKMILLEVFPEMAQATSEQIQMGYPYSLEIISQYYPEVFTKERLAEFGAKLKKM